MTIEEYLRHLVAKDLSAEAIDGGSAKTSGMVWEDGLLIYGAGTRLPADFMDDALRQDRQNRHQHLLDRRD